MSTHKITILYVISKSRINKKGEVPVICRITFLGKRKQFATGQFINPSHWHSKHQIAKPPNEENNNINSQLSLIKSKINKAFLFLQIKEQEFGVDDIYNQFLGKRIASERTLLDAFDYHVNRMQQLVGLEVKQVSVEKYNQSLVHIKSFLKFKFNKRDYLLKDLKLNFLLEFEYYLKTEKKFSSNTVYKTIQRLRRVVRVSVGAEFLLKDPFILHKAKKPKKEVIYLNESELKNLVNYKFSQERLQFVNDLFIFCCYTGLGFQEMKNLQSNHIIKSSDGNLCIDMLRQKTDKKIYIPLLPKAIYLLEKYGGGNIKNFKKFPTISNQKFNSYLKEIADILGLQKNLTHHIARKTFATTVLLSNGVPMEIVSELLGHSNMNITQAHYGKIVKSKISDEMKKLY
ncbi:tyrosine-type recombinase/integrase [Polaribacter sp.]|uniref:tyrosine-type recombinase/integrase n=2 Tax=Polaribacter sp. TaxID=1920175 RepID=UPI004047DD22